MKTSNKNLVVAVILGAVFSGSAWACGGACPWKKKDTRADAAAAPVILAEAQEKDSGQTSENGITTAKGEWITLKVEGMTCESCEFNVKRALKKVKGVKEAKASAKEGNAQVLYDADKAKPEDLVLAINKTGYKASLPDSSTGE